MGAVVRTIIAVLAVGWLTARAEPSRVIDTTIADLIAQPWTYHHKTVRVTGVLRYVFMGRGSRMNIGPGRDRDNLVDVESMEPGTIWLPLWRYSWARVELTAFFDGTCVIPRGDGMITVCADGGLHGYLFPKAVKVLGYVEPVSQAKGTVTLLEIDPASPSADGIAMFAQAIASAVARRNADALMALDEPPLDPLSADDIRQIRTATQDMFFADDMRIFNQQSPAPGRDYRLYHEDGYTLRRQGEDYLCFCKQASCEGHWPRAAEIFEANPTRPWVCYRVTQQNGRWYFE